jgi:hypothetical protein
MRMVVVLPADVIHREAIAKFFAEVVDLDDGAHGPTSI